ncbi:hypothetical protein [Metabacillus fastidiosus]|uniref:hypothetical protein n=1 Tax=Metabacillus fastidiosus TaxID=1458 RepID=UPI003D2D5FC0
MQSQNFHAEEADFSQDEYNSAERQPLYYPRPPYHHYPYYPYYPPYYHYPHYPYYPPYYHHYPGYGYGGGYGY